MKILIPILGFGNAGGYRVLSELANHWLDAGHKVDFLTCQHAAQPYFPTRAGILKYNANGLTVIENHHPTRAPGLYFGMWKALRAIGNDYDIVLANHSLTAFPVYFSGVNIAKCFYYIQAYEPEYYELESGAKNFLLKYLSKASYKLRLHQIANAPIYLSYKEIKALQWIPPGIDAKVFYRRSTSPRFQESERITLGIIGRREPSKGTQYALDAFIDLALADPRVHLKVAFGNLPEGWRHERASVVKIQGDHQLADFYRTVDIMIAPGIVQLGACTYPVLESMACGTPIITTDYLPADDSNAFKVPVKNSQAIVKAVQSIIEMPRNSLEEMLDRAWSATQDYHWNQVALRFSMIFGEN